MTYSRTVILFLLNTWMAWSVQQQLMRLSVCSTAKFFVLYFSLNKLNDGDNDRMKDSDNDRKSPTQFTKRLYGLCYEERLTKLGSPSLELRRLYNRYCYKIVFGLVTLNTT